MEVTRPNATEPTPAELMDLDKLKLVIERAIADCKLSEDELRQIKAIVWADGKVTPQELNLISEMVSEKLRNGELEWVW